MLLVTKGRNARKISRVRLEISVQIRIGIKSMRGGEQRRREEIRQSLLKVDQKEKWIIVIIITIINNKILSFYY